jgi:hypothetical protein
LHANRGQRIADLFELEWFDDGDDQFHENFPCRRSPSEPREKTFTDAGAAPADKTAHDIGCLSRN